MSGAGIRVLQTVQALALAYLIFALGYGALMLAVTPGEHMAAATQVVLMFSALWLVAPLFGLGVLWHAWLAVAVLVAAVAAAHRALAGRWRIAALTAAILAWIGYGMVVMVLLDD